MIKYYRLYLNDMNMYDSLPIYAEKRNPLSKTMTELVTGYKITFNEDFHINSGLSYIAKTEIISLEDKEKLLDYLRSISEDDIKTYYSLLNKTEIKSDEYYFKYQQLKKMKKEDNEVINREIKEKKTELRVRRKDF